MSEFDTSNLPGRGIKPLVSLLAHPRLAVGLFLLILIAGMPLVFIKGKPMYATTAVLSVSPSYMKNIRDDGELSFPSNTQYRAFLEQQTKSVLRYDIVRDALRSLEGQPHPWRRPGESERMAVDRLRHQMAVRSVPDTYMIQVSLQNPSKEGLAEIINAVVNTYVERMRQERVFGSDVRIRNLEVRERELAERVASKVEQRTGLALQLGISAFSGKEENPYDRVLADLRANLAKARTRRFEAEAKLEAFLSRGETDIDTRSIQEAVLIDPGLSNLKSNLYKRRADLITQRAGLTENHPSYQDLGEEMQRIEAEITEQTEILSERVRSSLLARYRTTVDQARSIEDELVREFREQEQRGARFADLYNQAMALTLDIEQQRKELATIRERLNVFAAEENSLGFVRLITPALPPELPFGPGKKKILIMLLVLALGAGLAAPTALDLLDRRVHTVNDAERVLGIPALGWLVERRVEATRMFGEDQLRRMAGKLLRERKNHGTQVFAFTSVKPGAGSSTLVQELGRCLASLGASALLVEANAFKPDGRLRAGAGRDRPGLAQCLQQQLAPADCILAGNDGLDHVWVGDLAGSRHLDRLDRMPELVRQWAGDYDFVLVDIPPILLSADAELLAHSLEHLILVVEAAGITQGELRRAGRQIEKLQPAAVGVLVNRVRPFEGGGYLHNLLVEYLTARKSRDYFTQPAWLLEIRTRLAAFTDWRTGLFNRKTTSGNPA